MLMGVVVSLFSQAATAQTLRYGPSYIEQGDFILHPGVQLALWKNEEHRFRFDFYGRRFGPFLEATAIVGADKFLRIFPWQELVTVYGFSVMDEYTAVNRPQGEDEAAHALNLGLNLGLSWRLLQHEAWDVRAEWNAHIFAAGLAFIVLTTARKSVFTLSVGYTL
jgi:hypothetical protein